MWSWLDLGYTETTAPGLLPLENVNLNTLSCKMHWGCGNALSSDRTYILLSFSSTCPEQTAIFSSFVEENNPRLLFSPVNTVQRSVEPRIHLILSTNDFMNLCTNQLCNLCLDCYKPNDLVHVGQLKKLQKITCSAGSSFTLLFKIWLVCLSSTAFLYGNSLIVLTHDRKGYCEEYGRTLSTQYMSINFKCSCHMMLMKYERRHSIISQWSPSLSQCTFGSYSFQE